MLIACQHTLAEHGEGAMDRIVADSGACCQRDDGYGMWCSNCSCSGRSGHDVEFVGLRAGVALSVVAVAVVVGGVAAHLRASAAPACSSNAALGQVYAALRDRFHLESVFLNDIRTLSGGWFSSRYDCSAEVTEIRGNVTASGLPWRAVRYQIVRRETSPYADVTVSVGGNVPLAPGRRSLWQRLFGWQPARS